MKDTIYRQAAIDAIDEQITARLDWITDSRLERQGLDVARIVIETLPSAQPEHDCSTCRYSGLEWDEEPCDSCTSGGVSSHWKPSAQPEPEHTMEEFMYGQDLGSPEDGSL